MTGDRVELACTVRGEGRPVVLLHGLYGSGGNLNRFVRLLADRYQVLAPDLRNHGRSPHHARMDYEAMAADVGALLERHGIGEAAVLGHSMGGKVAMMLALEQPERVAALIAADIAPVSYQHGHDTVIAALQAVDIREAGSRRDVDRALSAYIHSPGVRQFLLTNLVPQRDGYGWRIPLQILAEAVPAIEGFPDSDGRYTGPTLFLYGDQSEYFVPERHAEAARRLFPDAELEALQGAGHWLHAEQPEAFGAAVERFLDRNYPPGS